MRFSKQDLIRYNYTNVGVNAGPPPASDKPVDIIVPLELEQTKMTDPLTEIDDAVQNVLDESKVIEEPLSVAMEIIPYTDLEQKNQDVQRKWSDQYSRADYSVQSRTNTVIQILPSSDGQSLGVFSPLPFGSSGYSIVSRRYDFDSSAMLALTFPSKVFNYFDQSVCSVEQLIDIDSHRSNVPIFCIGESRYGTVVHPLLRTHAIAHEMYYILFAFQRNENILEAMDYVDRHIQQYVFELKQYSTKAFGELKSSLVQQYIFSNILRNASRIVNQVLTANEDDDALMYTLLGYDSEIYHKDWLEEYTLPEKEAKTSVLDTEKMKPQDSSPIQTKKESVKKKPGKRKQEPIKKELDTQRRTQIFLNQIFPKQ